VNEEEIEDFIPEVIAKLSWLDREELIKKFVSVEFNRFLEYYKDAPDLNVDEKKEEKENKKQSKNKTESKKGEFTRLFLSLGRKDRIVPQRIIGLINDYCPNTRVEIGKIDILDNFSYIEIGSNDVDDVLFAFEDKFYKGRALTFELAQAKKPTKTKRRDSKTKNQEFKTKNQNNKTKNKNRKS
jgi:ATP-dependent RNA helicase DeaD